MAPPGLATACGNLVVREFGAAAAVVVLLIAGGCIRLAMLVLQLAGLLVNLAFVVLIAAECSCCCCWAEEGAFGVANVV